MPARALRRLAPLAAALALACGGDDGGGSPAPDTGPSDAAADASPDADPDTAGPPACEPPCGPHGACQDGACACDEGFAGPACEGCAPGRFGDACAPCACVRGTCDEGPAGSGACACPEGFAGPTCADLAPFEIPWSAGPYGVGIRDTAGDFTVTTLAGPWTFSEAWTGEDSYLFVMKYGASAGGMQVWSDPELAGLFAQAPPNVQIFFGSYDDTFHQDVVDMSGRVELALGVLPAAAQAQWAGRVHFIDQHGAFLGGALRDFVVEHGYLFFAIDRFQRWREVGSLYDWPAGRNRIAYVAHEAVGFEHEHATEERLRELRLRGAVEVPLWDGDPHPGGWGGGYASTWTATLPDEEAMAGFDSLALDLYTACPGHRQGKAAGCNEWDYIQTLFLCDRPIVPAIARAEPSSCDPGAAAVAEVMGTCAGGGAACREAAECEGGAACEGYVAPVEAVPAETLPCECETPAGDVVDAARTCREDGGGFGACACACGTELARQVTSYGREGRWVTDLSPLLALLKRGGEQTFRFAGANGYTLHGGLLLWNAGKGYRPVSARYLWGKPGGEPFGPDYNDGRHPDVTFDVPEGVVRVEIAAYVSGHGHSSTAENCAEFCNHQHAFTLNAGTPDEAIRVKTHPVAGTTYGCRDQIAQGTVPNQYGTWILGRGGWCAGLDVPLWTADLTEDAKPAGNVLSYQGLYNGAAYTPTITDPGGYLPEMKLSSWLVLYEAAP